VIGARIRERGQPELADAPQALNFSRIEQLGNNRVLVGLEGNEAVNWISQDHRDEPFRANILRRRVDPDPVQNVSLALQSAVYPRLHLGIH
jgi:hypothetical protein